TDCAAKWPQTPITVGRRHARVGLLSLVALLSLSLRPGVHPPLEYRERKRAVPEKLVMKSAYIEPGSKGCSSAFRQFENFELTDFVTERLARHNDIAVHFGLYGRLVLGRMGMEVIHHLLPGPMLLMDARVHYQPDRAKHFTAEAAILTGRVSVQANLLTEALGIQGPALHKGRVIDGVAAESRQSREFLGN